MRIALISDIHGNMTAFEAALSLIERVDKVVCLGDVAATGPQPHETITALKKLRYPCVMGNGDEPLAKGVLEKAWRPQEPERERRMFEELGRWTLSQLAESDRAFLSTFKPKITIKTEAGSLLCYHGSPKSNTEGIHPATPDGEVSKIIVGQDATILAGGHTHSQMFRHLGSSLIINPGSVGLPYEKDAAGMFRNPTWAEYAIVSLGDKRLKVELCRVPYSLAKLAKAVRASGMPNQDWWLADWFQAR